MTLALDVLDDLIRCPDGADRRILQIVGLGLSAGIILMAAGLWLAGKAGI